MTAAIALSGLRMPYGRTSALGGLDLTVASVILTATGLVTLRRRDIGRTGC